MTTTVTLRTRYVGDDWTIVATTPDDVSDWTDLTVQIRKRASARAEVLVANDDIVTTGDVGLGVPATDFADGVLSIHVPAAVTALVADAPSAFVEAKVTSPTLGGTQTVFRANMPIEDD